MKTKLKLPAKPTLSDFQKYVRDMVIERGFEKETLTEVFMLFTEECGELAKAIRKSTDMHVDASSKKHELSHEAADTFILLVDLCNKLDIDLEKAFREKEKINQKRTWSKESKK